MPGGVGGQRCETLPTRLELHSIYTNKGAAHRDIIPKMKHFLFIFN